VLFFNNTLSNISLLGVHSDMNHHQGHLLVELTANSSHSTLMVLSDILGYYITQYQFVELHSVMKYP